MSFGAVAREGREACGIPGEGSRGGGNRRTLDKGTRGGKGDAGVDFRVNTGLNSKRMAERGDGEGGRSSLAREEGKNGRRFCGEGRR